MQDDLAPLKEKFQDAFIRVWTRQAENDGFNRLVLGAELEWHEVVVMRAYAKYLRQVGVTLSEAYIQQTLAKHPAITRNIIVLFGSKGGFVVKNPSADRATFQQEGVESYKTLLRGMLDITDNLYGDQLILPKDVVRRDADDPYLVVAADKGTATFSDIANAISGEYNFWLGDAFASGGSAGYDHKGMGITARGGWEAVKRHFRELGLDTQTEDFTAAGVGDMSGDVFGNAMLLSHHIKLFAAFNH